MTLYLNWSRYILLLSLVIFMACKGGVIDGNNTLDAVSIEIVNFNQIEITDGIDVDITVTEGEQPWARIEGESNLLPFVQIENNNGLLKIKVKRGTFIEPNIPINVIIGTPKLNYIKKQGASRVKVKGLRVGNFQVHAEGTGDVFLSGTVDTFIARRMGSGNIHAEALNARDGEIYNVGHGDTYIGSVGRLSVKIDGSGDVICADNTDVYNKKIKGAGKIRYETR